MLTPEEVQAAEAAGIVVPPSIVGATVQFVGPSWVAFGGPYEWWRVDGQLVLRKEPRAQ